MRRTKIIMNTFTFNKFFILSLISIASTLIFTGCNSNSSTYHIDKSIIQNMAAPTNVDNINITDEMKSKSITSIGDTSKLADVMNRAAAGEDLTIAFLGGSITAGSNAEPMESSCFASLTTNWWTQTFPNANFTYVNAGIGATDSYLGVHRLYDDVLSHNPDLVILEFAVNDCKTINPETYENIIRNILSYESSPALITLMLTQKNLADYSAEHTEIANYYNLPIISYRDIYCEGLSEEVLSWESVGCEDGVHPINGGHELIAYSITSFFCNVLQNINNTSYEEYILPKEPLTSERFNTADIYYSDEIDASYEESFTEQEINDGLSNTNGWQTTEGGSIEYSIKAKSIGILYLATNDNKSGQFDIYVDNQLITTIDADYKDGWGNKISYADLGNFEVEDTHEIKIILNSDSTNNDLYICGITHS